MVFGVVGVMVSEIVDGVGVGCFAAAIRKAVLPDGVVAAAAAAAAAAAVAVVVTFGGLLDVTYIKY